MAIGLDPKILFSRATCNQREVFESITNKGSALGMRKAGSGVMTDKDFEVFKSMVGGLRELYRCQQGYMLQS